MISITITSIVIMKTKTIIMATVHYHVDLDHQGDVIPLTCEIKFTHEAEFLTWMVDGEIQVSSILSNSIVASLFVCLLSYCPDVQGEDYHPVREGDLLVSSYQFIPQSGQTKVNNQKQQQQQQQQQQVQLQKNSFLLQVECLPNGQEELSAKVSFAIRDASEDAAKEKEDKVFWVPHQSDATDYISEDRNEENEDEEMLELRMAEEEFRRAEMVEEVASVGRQNTGLKVEEEIDSTFNGLMSASLHSSSASSLHSLYPLTFSLLVLVSLLLRGN